MTQRRPSLGSRVVGILGGMGPAATVDFYSKLVRNTPAQQDQDHLRVVIWADPTVPSRQDALLDGGTDPTPWLEEGISHLVDSGAEIIVVPCNTIHAYLPRVMAAQPVEFISIIEATAAAIVKRGARRVGLLATDGAIAAGLFQRAFEDAGIEWVLPTPSQQSSLMSVVNAVKAGRDDVDTYDNMGRLLKNLHTVGVEVIVAGCTEVSAGLEHVDLSHGPAVIDPALELALHTIERARASE